MTIQVDTWENRLLTLAYAPLTQGGTMENWASDHWPSFADPSALDLAYVYSEEITKEHSATFYLASALLAAEQRKAIRALYAFCRVSDDLVDRPGRQLGCC